MRSILADYYRRGSLKTNIERGSLNTGAYIVYLVRRQENADFMKGIWETVALLCAMAFMVPGLTATACYAADKNETTVEKTQQKQKKDLQKIIFEEQKIEGKIRRPQMVLIKADERPVFSPMVMPSFGKTDDISEFVDQSVIEKMPNQGPFQFEGGKIYTIVK